MNPNKLGSAAPVGGAEKTSNFTAEQNPVKNFEAEKFRKAKNWGGNF